MDANEGKAWWVLGPHSHFNQRGAHPAYCVPRENKDFSLLDFINKRGKKWGLSEHVVFRPLISLL